ncbi:hypothetical protein ACOMHN_036513 [Nucella lapillus]
MAQSYVSGKASLLCGPWHRAMCQEQPAFFVDHGTELCVRQGQPSLWTMAQSYVSGTASLLCGPWHRAMCQARPAFFVDHGTELCVRNSQPSLWTMAQSYVSGKASLLCGPWHRAMCQEQPAFFVDHGTELCVRQGQPVLLFSQSTTRQCCLEFPRKLTESAIFCFVAPLGLAGNVFISLCYVELRNL